MVVAGRLQALDLPLSQVLPSADLGVVAPLRRQALSYISTLRFSPARMELAIGKVDRVRFARGQNLAPSECAGLGSLRLLQQTQIRPPMHAAWSLGKGADWVRAAPEPYPNFL